MGSAREELVWINGRLLPFSEATISVEDRGFQFADGVYEVCRVYDGTPFALGRHLDRLRASCAGLDLPLPYTDAQLTEAIATHYERQPLPEAMMYLQVTRGPAPRNHIIARQCSPTVLLYTRPLSVPIEPQHVVGARVITVDDDRWKRCWIKAIGLLPNSLAKTAADRAGADEAVFVDNGLAVEASSSNLFVVRNATLVTAPPGPKVLPGITRQVLLELAAKLNIAVEDRAPMLAEAESADEAFVTSTIREVGWIRSWNGKPIGDGKPGAITLRLHSALRDYIRGS